MAEQTDDNICSICLNDLIQPKLLECYHSFCCTCLQDFIQKSSKDNQFQCPICRRHITIPDGGVEAFIPDIQANYLELPKCDFCKAGTNSDVFCQNCNKYMCVSCETVHNFVNGSSDHVVLNLNGNGGPRADKSITTQVKQSCLNHHEKGADIYCKSCMESICNKCFILHHNGHIYLDLEDESEVKTEIKLSKRTIESHFGLLNSKFNEVQTSTETACENVDMQIEKVYSEMKKLGDELKDKLRTNGKEEGDKLNKMMDEIQILTDKVKVDSKYSSDVDDPVSSVVYLLPEVKHMEEEIISRKLHITDEQYPWFQEVEINKSELSRHLGGISNSNTPIYRIVFNLEDVSTSQYLFSPTFEVQGIKWSIQIKKHTERVSTSLSVYLCMGTRFDDSTQTCSIDSTIQLLDQIHHKYTKTRHLSFSFSEENASYGWPSFVAWSKLCDINSGYLGKNNNFIIQVSITIK